MCRKDISEGTRRLHYVLIRELKEFGKISSFSTVTKKNILPWDEFLHAKGISQVSVFGYHKRLKIYINQAIKLDSIQSSPYSTLSFERGKTEKVRYLTIEEINKIKECELPTDSLRQVRDAFLFQCYTGLAYFYF